MEIRNLNRTVAKAFGLPVLNPASLLELKDQNDQVIDTVSLIGYWVAEISFFSPKRSQGASYHDLVVSVIKTKNWAKGIIMIPPIREPLDRETGGPDPLHPIDITQWRDPVEQTFHSLDIFPISTSTGTILDDEDAYHFAIEYGTKHTFGKFHMNGPVDRLPPTDLWKALIRTVHHFVNVYENDELRDFIATPDSRYLLDEDAEDLDQI